MNIEHAKAAAEVLNKEYFIDDGDGYSDETKERLGFPRISDNKWNQITLSDPATCFEVIKILGEQYGIYFVSEWLGKSAMEGKPTWAAATGDGDIIEHVTLEEAIGAACMHVVGGEG